MPTQQVFTYVESAFHGNSAMICFYGPIREYAFVWQGGQYIDVYILTSDGPQSIEGKDYAVSDCCINLRSMDGTPIIDWADRSGFLASVSDWLLDNYMN